MSKEERKWHTTKSDYGRQLTKKNAKEEKVE